MIQPLEMLFGAFTAVILDRLRRNILQLFTPPVKASLLLQTPLDSRQGLVVPMISLTTGEYDL